jgi:hypothetical protein
MLKASFSLLILLVLPALLLLGGVVLTRLGLRGRRVDDHPICRKCGFDLIGLPAGGERCSECGADLAAPRAIEPGRRRRRPVMLGAGLFMLAIVLVLGGLLAWALVRNVDRYALMPTWYLMREARSTSASDAWAELARRLRAGAMAKEQTASAVEQALVIQGDRSRTWVPVIGDFVEQARTNGQATDAQWQRYARQAPALTLTLRPQVRRGDDVPARISAAAARVGTTSRLSVRVRQPVGRGDLIKPRDPRRYGSGYVGFGLSTNGGASTSETFETDKRAAATAPAGVREATVSAKLAVVERGDFETKQPLVEWDEAFNASWELVDADTITPIDDESHRAAVEKGTRVKFLGTRSGNSGDSLSLELEFSDIPVPLAHEVLLREPGGREHRLTSINLRPGNMGYSTGGQLKELKADTVDVVFRPSPASARGTVDVTELWNHEFVVKNVAVQRPAPATKPATTGATAR